jgi:hypothetical protein
LVLGCKAGYYLTRAKICQLCPIGTWSKAGATKCTKCPAGTKTSDHLSCKDCPAGKYSLEKSAKCTLCGVGQVSKAKSSKCTACTGGQYASRSDSTCKPCAKGTYSTGPVDSCTKCAVGSYSDPGENTCTPCLPGQRYDSTNLWSKCLDCLPLTYSTNPSEECKECPAGSYSSYGATVCTMCDTAKGYVPNEYNNGCECADGGVFDDVLQACSVCKPGYKMKPGGGDCVACEAGYYSVKVGQGSCVPCNSNKLVNADRTRCEYCPPSFEMVSGQCEQCPSGKYSSGDIRGCQACYGSYVPNSAQTGCNYGTPKPSPQPIVRKVCPPGQGYTKASPELCVDCGPGSMSFNQTCIFCAVGTYSDTPRPASCTVCPDTMVVSPDRTKCAGCAASFFKQEYPQDYPLSSPGREATCLKCPAETYSKAGSKVCLECPNYTPVNADQTGCLDVPPGPIILPNPPRAEAGKVWDIATQSIKDCEAGYEKLYSLQTCTPCMIGYYSKLPGTAVCSICDGSKVVTADRTDCVSCQPGYTKTPHEVGIFPYTADVEATCVRCPSDTISDGGLCERCPLWEIPNSDQSYCRTPDYNYCTGGTIFSTVIGECVPCSPGHADYYVHPCQQCPYNTYQPYYGKTYCEKCPLGMVTGLGRDDCYFCEAGYFPQRYEAYGSVPYDGPASECLKCAAGTYSVYADTKCHTCPTGKKVNALQTGCE